ncbi:gliding motility-associated C-terminal domain-containing protein [Agriterribacter humi]|uniref:gliding motility-associated C-terminal domain-containing protein n=1 Tax=Agriterribacter humi TaxID=1104781 RepID=UPI001264A2B0|nr:gliding motility-associated C-terminal domain-containing protein [Agriterribacter humi]
MGNYARMLFFITGFISPFFGKAQTANFSTPDTVCISEPVNITNHSAGATSYYWNFCVADIVNTPPVATNLGNPGNLLNMPVFSDFVEADGNFFVFVVNHVTAELIRLDFGSSLLNTPSAVNLGNIGGVLKTRIEGIQIINETGKWYIFIVGGDPDYGNVPQIVKIDFGANISNNTPTAVDWGNLGAMYQPLDLYMFKENNNWHGFTVNKNGSITRFNFANGLDNAPDAENHTGLGLIYPTGINVLTDKGEWYAFITTAHDNGITRLEFGNSLLNDPIAFNLGNPGNALNSPRDVYIMKFCDAIVGFAVNGSGNDIARFNFHNDLERIPSGISLGNIGTLNFPHSLSKLFRVNDKVYTFITNVNNNTITRVEFPSCTNSSLPGFNLENPPPIIYDAPGVYNINLTIDDGLPSQSSFCRQVVVVPKPVHKLIQTFTINPGEDIKIGTDNPSGTYTWNTGEKTDSIIVQDEGIYWVETTGYGCSNRDSFLLRYAITADFTYKQDVCNPLLFEFRNETAGSTVINWDFGSGPVAPGENNPSTTYSGFGNYDVTLKLETFGGNIVSVTKQIAVQVAVDSLIITNDTTICEGSSLQLNAIPALKYCWSPAAGLSSTGIANPIAAPNMSTTYYLTSLANGYGTNIIVNGDFSAGNTGFTSEYNLAPISTTEAEYFVGPSSKAWNPHLEGDCPDHSGNGNMLLVNGAPQAGVNVWTQTVNVTPNTNYSFSTWIEALFRDNPAQLSFSINGNDIGDIITASLPICTWTQFYTTWNSGNNTTATIAIVNKNTLTWGNDFALDDISFAPVTIKRDSVVITIEKPPVVRTNNDTLVCEGSVVQLNTMGAGSYSWTPATGLSAADVANPQASPVNTTQYIVTGTTAAGCSGKDMVTISVKPKPAITITNDTLICSNSSLQLNAGGGNAYLWSPAATLDNTAISNPTALPMQNAVYRVLVTDANNCTNTDSVKVGIRPYPKFSVSQDQSICEGSSAMLTASGGDMYQWTPDTSVDSPQEPSTRVSPAITTSYTVRINESICHNDTLMNVRVDVNPTPAVSALKLNDINCTVRTAQLQASGADVYTWSPGIYLNDMNRANPVAIVDSTTTFIVTGTSQHGCPATDSVTVKVTADGRGLFLVPNAFTPNGDGLNDCFGLSKWGNIQIQEFSVYSRWGELVFTAKNSSQCWDGTFKGIEQPSGSFVYVIKAKTFCGTIDRKGLITLIR